MYKLSGLSSLECENYIRIEMKMLTKLKKCSLTIEILSSRTIILENNKS